jgi:hypothetical protein
LLSAPDFPCFIFFALSGFALCFEIERGLGIRVEGFGSIQMGAAIDRPSADSGACVVLREKSDADSERVPEQMSV